MTTNLHAYGAGTAPPTNDKAPAVAAAEARSKTININQDASADSAERVAVEQADKDFATLRARLALHGFTVQIVGDGAGGTAYMVSRWAIHRTLPDLAGVREFANRVGVQHG